jgi:hypothetical protein
MSLGNLTGALFSDACMGIEQHSHLSFSLTPLPRGAMLDVRFGL